MVVKHNYVLLSSHKFHLKVYDYYLDLIKSNFYLFFFIDRLNSANLLKYLL